MSAQAADEQDWVPRKLTHEQARVEQLRYWRNKSVADRLRAMTELNRRLYRMRGIDLLTLKQIGLLRAFAAGGVEHAVVGGVAVNANGYQRATVESRSPSSPGPT